MGDVRIFDISSDSVKELKSSSVAVEKSLQSFIERNLEKLFSIRFLETEYSTGKRMEDGSIHSVSTRMDVLSSSNTNGQ